MVGLFHLEINRLALINDYSYRTPWKKALKLHLMKEAADKNEYFMKDDSYKY